MKNFVAIDFETANGSHSSVCSVGIVVVRDGEIVDSFYSLIHPEPNYYSYMCMQVNGLTQDDTEDAPTFPCVWRELMQHIEPYFPQMAQGEAPFVAHYAVFDRSCLQAAFQTYGMDYPDYQFLCTRNASRRHFGNSLPNHQLHIVAAACGYNLENHHHALADAEACAAIAMKIL